MPLRNGPRMLKPNLCRPGVGRFGRSVGLSERNPGNFPELLLIRLMLVLPFCHLPLAAAFFAQVGEFVDFVLPPLAVLQAGFLRGQWGADSN
jgi:hypothetical protein